MCVCGAIGVGHVRGRGGLPHPAQPQHTNDGAPRTRKRHQQEHRPQQPTERSDPTQHAKGRAGDCPGPHKETTQPDGVSHGGGMYAVAHPCAILPPPPPPLSSRPHPCAPPHVPALHQQPQLKGGSKALERVLLVPVTDRVTPPPRARMLWKNGGSPPPPPRAGPWQHTHTPPRTLPAPPPKKRALGAATPTAHRNNRPNS